MDLYQLKTFHTFGKVLSFTETARIMYVSQSAISHAIKKLEISLGTRLVERRSKKLTLTTAGRELFKTCEIIFFEIEKVTQTINRLNKKTIIEVCIGSTVEFGTSILIKHLKTFMKQNPDIKVDFLFSHHLSKPLIADEVDFIIDCNKHFSPELEEICLFQEDYVVIASPDFIEANNVRQYVDLEKVTILSLDKDGLWWKNFLVSLDVSQRPELNNICQINHVRGIINGAIEGVGIGFVPRYTIVKELAENVVTDLFPQLKIKADQFCIYIKRNKLHLDKNKLLIDYLTTIKPAEFSGQYYPLL